NGFSSEIADKADLYKSFQHTTGIIQDMHASAKALSEPENLEESKYNSLALTFEKQEDELREAYFKMFVDVTSIISKIREKEIYSASVRHILLLIILFILGWLISETFLKDSKIQSRKLKAASKELLQEQQYLSSIVNSQTNFILRANKEGNINFANPSFYKSFHYTEDDLIGKPFFVIILPRDLM